MKNTVEKRNDNVRRGKIDLTKVPRGHQSHRSGGGVHDDRRQRRLKTRNAALNYALCS